ncbi:MAG: hypothetical protein AAGA03_04740 [Planctomycetota bacterium]
MEPKPRFRPGHVISRLAKQRRLLSRVASVITGMAAFHALPAGAAIQINLGDSTIVEGDVGFIDVTAEVIGPSAPVKVGNLQLNLALTNTDNPGSLLEFVGANGAIGPGQSNFLFGSEPVDFLGARPSNRPAEYDLSVFLSSFEDVELPTGRVLLLGRFLLQGNPAAPPVVGDQFKLVANTISLLDKDFIEVNEPIIVSGGNIEVVAIPEPSLVWLGSVLAGVTIVSRRRRP